MPRHNLRALRANKIMPVSVDQMGGEKKTYDENDTCLLQSSGTQMEKE